MKANAKKLLALILAMVMCLSLAAPAMAAGAEAVAEATLSVQVATKVVKSIVAKENDAKTNNIGALITIGDAGVATATSTPTSTDQTAEVLFDKVDKELAGGASSYTTDAVTVTRVDKIPAKVGQGSIKTYTVKPNAGWGDAKAVDIDSTRDDALKLKKDIKFTDLSADKTQIFAKGGSNFMAQGGYYGEKQLGTNWKVFFKLSNTTVANAFETDETKVTYAVAEVSDFATTPTAAQIKAALAVAVVCNDETGMPTTGTVPAIALNPANVTGDTEWSVISPAGATIVGESKWWAAITITSDLYTNIVSDSATYQVRSTYETTDTTNTTSGKTVRVESDANKVKADLETGIKDMDCHIEITAITAGANGFFNVTVKKTGYYDSGYNGAVGANTAIFNNADGYTDTIILIDAAQPGTYTPAGGNQTTINEGYKLESNYYAVKKSDLKTAKVATSTDLGFYLAHNRATETSDWYYFDSKWDMMECFESTSCATTATLPYKQLLAFVKEGTTKNDGVELVGGVYVPTLDWASKSGAATKAGTVTVEKEHQNLVVVTRKKNPTCKKEGEIVDEVTCGDCNKVISSTVVSKIPKIETSVLVSDKDHFYIIDATTYTAKNPATGDPYVPAATLAAYPNFALYKASADAHYIAEHEAVVVKNDKTNTGTITHKFKDNLGEYHEEYEYTEDMKKATLDFSGRWDYMATSTQNTQFARDPLALYGYTFYVADTDVEYTSAPIMETANQYFQFPTSAITQRTDGTYVDTDTRIAKIAKLDANGKVVTDATATRFQAIARVKNIKVAEKDCLDGSATVEISVYKVTRTINDLGTNDEDLEKAIKDNEAVLVKTHTKDIVVKAVKDHVDANNDGKCDNCGTEIKQNVTPEPQPETKTLTASMVTVKNLTYTGKKQQPEVTVKAADGTELEEGIDYDVATFKKTAVGTYTITVKGKGDWSGKVKATVKIKKAANPIKVAKTSVAVKAKDVKKKAKTIALKVTKAQGKVTVKSSKKKVVSWKNNKITVAKAAKKGTYKLTFTAKGNKNYKKGTKTVKVVVK